MGLLRPAMPSGFLSDYSTLAPVAQSEGTLIYRDPAAALERYDKCVVDSIGVYFGPSKKSVIVPAFVVALVGKYLAEEAVEQTGKFYQLTKEPGENVLHFRVAITILSIPQEAGPFSRRGVHETYWPGSLQLEMELLDSQSGQQYFAFVNKSYFAGTDHPSPEEIQREIESRSAMVSRAMKDLLTKD